MAGHSKWAKIKRDKGANDAKRGAIFTRIGKQIAIAARKGTDPSMNPALALAIEKAKAANMPNSNIQRAIDRVNDKNAAALEEITYEAYGPGGAGLIIEAATDNRNRTLPEIKTVLDAGAEDANEEENEIIVYTNQKDLAKVRQSIINAGLKVIEAELQYIANNEVEINDPEVARKMIKLMDVLDEVDDIVNVYTNADITVEL